MVHGNLDIGNVFVDADNKVTVVDCGLPLKIFRRDTMFGINYHNETPEQRKKPQKSPGDMWCLGLLVYEMIVGVSPFQVKAQFEGFVKGDATAVRRPLKKQSISSIH